MLNRNPAEDEWMATSDQEALTARKTAFAENYQNLVLSLLPGVVVEQIPAST